MLELLFIYFVGKRFYELADSYDKNKWLFVIISVVSYYGGIFLWMIALVITIEFSGGTIEDWSELALSLIALGLAILTVVGFYKLLKNKWEQDKSDQAVLDEDI